MVKYSDSCFSTTNSPSRLLICLCCLIFSVETDLSIDTIFDTSLDDDREGLYEIEVKKRV